MRRTAVETASPPINWTARRRRPPHAARKFSDDFRISASHEGGTIMKQTLIRGSAVLALAGTWPAGGADLSGTASAPPWTAATHNWTGFYADGHFGYTRVSVEYNRRHKKMCISFAHCCRDYCG